MYKYYSEIKNRLFLLILVWLSTVLVSYLYKEVVLFLFLQSNSYLFKKSFLYFIFTNLTEIFSAYLKFSYFLGNQISLIYLIYSVFLFFSPGMYYSEFKTSKFVFILSIFLWVIAVVSFITFIFPVSIKFLYSFQKTNINQAFSFYYEAKINEYLDLFIMLYYFWCFGCQILLVIYVFLDYLENNLNFIKNFRKFFYLLFLIIASLISPPDVFSQLILGFLISGVFEILIVIIILKRKLMF